MTQSQKIRFLDNNLNDPDSAIVTYSSQLSTALAASNLSDQDRTTLWAGSGNFDVTSSNNLIYINDGSNKTVTLTAAAYATPTLLAAHIQTQLNASSSNWTCTWSATTNKFTISRSSGTAVLRLTQTTSAAWDMLGYLGTSDDSTGPFPADAPRIHTSEWYQLDLIMAYPVTAFAVIANLAEAFPLSTSATCRLLAHNIDGLWAAPALTVTITPESVGLLKFMDDLSNTSYRYWRFDYQDRMNANGPSSIRLGHLYLGDFQTVTATNIGQGFELSIADPSDRFKSQGGQQYFDVKTKYRTLSGASIANVPADDRRELQAMFQRLGIDQPFYLSIDPTLVVSEELSELTMYGRFSDPPSFGHIIRDYYDVGFGFEETP